MFELLYVAITLPSMYMINNIYVNDTKIQTYKEIKSVDRKLLETNKKALITLLKG